MHVLCCSNFMDANKYNNPPFCSKIIFTMAATFLVLLVVFLRFSGSLSTFNNVMTTDSGTGFSSVDIKSGRVDRHSFSCSATGAQNGRSRKIRAADIYSTIETPLVYPVPKSVMQKKSASGFKDAALLTPSKGRVHLNIYHSTRHYAHTQHIPSKDEWNDVCSNIIFSGDVTLAETHAPPMDNAAPPQASLLSVETVDVKVLVPNSQSRHVEYWLTIERNIAAEAEASVNVVAYSYQGVLAAVATLNQLIVDGNSDTLRPISLPLLIHDWSDYEWRGEYSVVSFKHFLHTTVTDC